jgi:hypothetical protein
MNSSTPFLLANSQFPGPAPSLVLCMSCETAVRQHLMIFRLPIKPNHQYNPVQKAPTMTTWCAISPVYVNAHGKADTSSYDYKHHTVIHSKLLT